MFSLHELTAVLIKTNILTTKRLKIPQQGIVRLNITNIIGRR